MELEIVQLFLGRKNRARWPSENKGRVTGSQWGDTQCPKTYNVLQRSVWWEIGNCQQVGAENRKEVSHTMQLKKPSWDLKIRNTALFSPIVKFNIFIRLKELENKHTVLVYLPLFKSFILKGCTMSTFKKNNMLCYFPAGFLINLSRSRDDSDTWYSQVDCKEHISTTESTKLLVLRLKCFVSEGSFLYVFLSFILSP